jgi:lipopolysaccharide/colanic/teichoic acid biosynthesis glycosyltransferase
VEIEKTAHGFLYRRFYARAKRWFDPPLALLALVIFAPVMILTALLILLTSGRPVLFCQTRTGYKNKPYKLYKFRTMTTSAEANGPRWSSASDSRVTKLGHWLRLMHLDELPQLWNVLLGQMSFVGPRPELPYFDDLISKEVPLFRLRYNVLPGITGWAQIRLGYASSIEEAGRKLDYDLYYMKRMSFWFDVIIILQTLTKFMPRRAPRIESL